MVLIAFFFLMLNIFIRTKGTIDHFFSWHFYTSAFFSNGDFFFIKSSGQCEENFSWPFLCLYAKWCCVVAPEITVYNIKRVFAGIVTINKGE